VPLPLASPVNAPRQPTFNPVHTLRRPSVHPDGLTFPSKSASLHIRALDHDLLHLRILRARSRAEPSWAVIRDSWTPIPVRTAIHKGLATLTTSSLVFRLHTATGAWSVSDAQGLTLFSAPPRSTGFAGPQPRLTLDLAPREAIFGLGESTGPFDKRGLTREFWNRDVLGHAPAIHPGLRSLYVAIPFALCRRDGRFAGLFWDNPARQVWDIGNTTPDRWQLSADSGAINLYVFAGPTPARVLHTYSQLTGTMPIPPRWALGYQQSRYSYPSRRHLEAVAREFRRRDIPCDVLHCDIHHMDRHRVFTFGKSFPNPAAMTASLARKGFKVVAIANPGIQDSTAFPVLRRGRALDAFVKDPSGRADALGKVWPGRSRFPDFTSARVRAWWASEQAAHLRLGVAGIWNDMNEPANFARPDKTLDPRARHHTDFGPRRHHQVHNIYGMQMARASRDGMLAWPAGSNPNPDSQPEPQPTPPHRIPRPFVITRAGYAGIQRHAIVWTGDNSSCWEHLADALQMILNLGLSGVPFTGADVAGFLDNPSPELFIRWLQFAIFTPFLRNHTNIDTRPQEPWAFGPDIESIARDFLNLRYQLIPYLYTLTREASLSGTPILRPLLWHHPGDPTAAACSDQALLGPNLLIAPILRPGTSARSIYLPRGEWFDFATGELLPGGGHVLRPAPLDQIPILVRAGAILPMTQPRPFIGPAEPHTVFLHVWPRDHASLDWYDDDGLSQAHTTGNHLSRTITHESQPSGGLLRIGPAIGPYQPATRTWRVVLRSLNAPVQITLNGRPIPCQQAPDLGIAAFNVPATPQASEARWKTQRRRAR